MQPSNLSNLPLMFSMGDPAGVGPELCLRAIEWSEAHSIPAVVAGSADVLGQVAHRLGRKMPAVVDRDRWESEGFRDGLSVVVDLPVLASPVVPGKVDASTGRASFAYIECAIDQALAGRIAGIVTGPIHKEAWHAAGVAYPGHTELLAERAGTGRHCMMLAAPEIRCALVTVHVGLGQVPELITSEAVLETLELAADAVQRTIGRSPRVVVLGLNPHAGEHGLFGRQEEQRAIIPAIEQARQRGWAVTGPLPPDTAFVPAVRKTTDVYICMYHDQGLIPLKAIAFDDAVNVTLGLRIVRTSVDHGTALDIAWQGIAQPSSMYAAVEMAWQLARQREDVTSG